MEYLLIKWNRSEPMKAYKGDSVGITFMLSGNVHTPVTHNISRTITTMCDHDIGVVVEYEQDELPDGWDDTQGQNEGR